MFSYLIFFLFFEKIRVGNSSKIDKNYFSFALGVRVQLILLIARDDSHSRWQSLASLADHGLL